MKGLGIWGGLQASHRDPGPRWPRTCHLTNLSFPPRGEHCRASQACFHGNVLITKTLTRWGPTWTPWNCSASTRGLRGLVPSQGGCQE